MLRFRSAKHPDETLKVTHSFARQLAAAETITSVTVVCADLVITNAQVREDGQGPIALAAGGADGDEPVIRFGAVTDQGQELFEEIILPIKNDPSNPT